MGHSGVRSPAWTRPGYGPPWAISVPTSPQPPKSWPAERGPPDRRRRAGRGRGAVLVPEGPSHVGSTHRRSAANRAAPNPGPSTASKKVARFAATRAADSGPRSERPFRRSRRDPRWASGANGWLEWEATYGPEGPRG